MYQKESSVAFRRTCLCLLMFAGILCSFTSSLAQDESDLKKLAEAAQNPVSDLVQLGFTNGTLFGAGANDYLFNVFNLQASTTRKIGDWALLNRLIIPVPYFPASAFANKTGSLTGLAHTEREHRNNEITEPLNMATRIPLESACLPVEMLVMMIAQDFPELAQDCDQILDEQDIPRELKEHEVRRTIELYQMRLEAGLIDTPPQKPFLKFSLMEIIRKKFL